MINSPLHFIFVKSRGHTFMIFPLTDIAHVESYKYINYIHYIHRTYNLYWLTWHSLCLASSWASWSAKLGRSLYTPTNFSTPKLREKNPYNYKPVPRVASSFACIHHSFIEYKIVFIITLTSSPDVSMRLYTVNVPVLYLACMIFGEICFFNKLT